MRQEMASAVGSAVVKTTPPLAVWVSAATGAIDMTFLVGIGTLIWLGTQTAYLVWKWVQEKRSKK